VTCIRLTIEGAPQSQKRHRTFSRGSKLIQFDPSSESKQIIRKSIIKQVIGKSAFDADVPLAVTIYCYMPIPKSYSKKKKEQCEINELFPVTKPDCDNLAKSYLDCMSGLVYHDDRQVIVLHIEKFYSLEPRTEIIVQRVGL